MPGHVFYCLAWVSREDHRFRYKRVLCTYLLSSHFPVLLSGCPLSSIGDPWLHFSYPGGRSYMSTRQDKR